MNTRKSILDKMRALLSLTFISFAFFTITGINIAYGVSCGGNCCPYTYSCNCTQYGCDTCTGYHGTMSCVSSSQTVTIKKLPYSVTPRAKSPDGCNDEIPSGTLTKLPFTWPSPPGSGTVYKTLPATVNYKWWDCSCSYSC